ncbi:MAG: response regulator [Rhodanobacteraceae bacterium]|nr:MAG: response regulator [Rhodanobacteraceae bacterium]
MDKEAGRYRVLLAEDDPVSQAFLCAAIRASGGEPTACADGPTALARAREGHWQLLILDQHLPGLDGDALLAALHRDPARAAFPPALATTADPDSVRARLLRAGFAEVLPKPLALETLQAALRRHGCRPAALDDEDALRACGSAAAVEHLRRLFAEQELPRVQHEFDQHGDNHAALRPTLHRLRASCGFCGAAALAGAAATLHGALANHADGTRLDAALKAFAQALRDTRTALHAQLNGDGGDLS